LAIMQSPLNVNSPGGFATELVSVLWENVAPKPDPIISELDRRVMADTGFPCVVLARFNFGLIAIDCCDANQWTLNDDRILIYLKMQFDPGAAYPRKVLPFTYISQRPIDFEQSLGQYRAAYAAAAKHWLAWGRFIAVSLERFHLAHAMRRHGIPGGCYVLCDEGYEDHTLDEASPRRRLPFADYLARMNQANWIIDAAGFGDLTHRLIESFGIGIPVIRPKLRNETSEPLLAGVHYLDCGPGGERLGEALEVAANHRIRRAIIDNAFDWYERNCTIAAIRRVFAARVAAHSQGQASWT
jgi:hypothetical protein